MEKHDRNIQVYLANNGDPKIAKMYRSPSLENRAKMLHFVKNLQDLKPLTEPEPAKQKPSIKTAEIVPVQKPPISKPSFIGLISQYPVELHATYNEVYAIWLLVCSLKIQLNEVLPDDDAKAYDLQNEILKKMDRFDRCKNALDHYLEFKRVLPTQSLEDYSKLSPLQLDKEARNLTSLICRRKVTISKMEKEMVPMDDKNYNKVLAALNRKRESLEEMNLNLEKVRKLLV
jgi:hypothetical protein